MIRNDKKNVALAYTVSHYNSKFLLLLVCGQVESLVYGRISIAISLV